MRACVAVVICGYAGQPFFTLRMIAVMLVTEASGPLKANFRSGFLALVVMATTVPANAGLSLS